MKKNFEKPEIKKITFDFSESIVASTTTMSWPFDLQHNPGEGCLVINTNYKEAEVQADFGKAIIAYQNGCAKSDPEQTYLRMMRN